MTVCPVAIAVGCQKCPIFKVCPLTTVLGDQKKDEAPQNAPKKASKPSKKKG